MFGGGPVTFDPDIRLGTSSPIVTLLTPFASESTFLVMNACGDEMPGSGAVGVVSVSVGGGLQGSDLIGDEPVSFCVGEIGSGVAEASGESLREISVVDGFGDGSLISNRLPCDKVLALVSGGTAASLAPLRGDCRGDEVEVVFLSASGDADALADGASSGEGSCDARCLSARSSASGMSRPRLPARLKIPAAAVELKKNLGAATSTSTSGKDEDTPPSLGNSEESAVQHSPGAVVKPELGQRREKDGEISSVVAGKESGNVLDEDEPSGSNKFISKPRKLEEQARSLARQSGPATSDREILARETTAQQIDVRHSIRHQHARRRRSVLARQFAHVREDGHVGPVTLQHATAVLVGFALEDDGHAGALKAEIESADA